MNARSRSLPLSVALTLLASPLASGQANAPRPARAAAAPGAGEAPRSDATIETFQVELLDLAFDAGSAFPMIHIKDRARSQDDVVAACLELDQPALALRYVEEIENWRRGSGYADLALYYARQGRGQDAERFLELAQGVAREVAAAGDQEWRYDRIRAKVAQTHLLLGNESEAAGAVAGAVDSESSMVEVVRAEFVEAEKIEPYLEQLDARLETGRLDQVRNAMVALDRLRERAEERDLRARIEEKIDLACSRLPLLACVETRLTLAAHALDRRDQAAAREQVDAARRAMEGGNWLPEDQVSLMARLARLRFQTGDEEAARKQLAAALRVFDRAREGIADFWRPDALRPVAEAHAALEDHDSAREVYARALAEGALNANARPRADDLIATLLSMATHGVEPDDVLWARILEIREGLQDPW